jgi:hypothetical protein
MPKWRPGHQQRWSIASDVRESGQWQERFQANVNLYHQRWR